VVKIPALSSLWAILSFMEGLIQLRIVMRCNVILTLCENGISNSIKINFCKTATTQIFILGSSILILIKI
jgi:hypothetical protein